MFCCSLSAPGNYIVGQSSIIIFLIYMEKKTWWFQEKGPVIPGPELGWFYGTQCLLGSTEDITDDFDILKFNLWCFNPFGRGYFLNNQPANSIYGICKLFSQELLKVFLPNSLVEI